MKLEDKQGFKLIVVAEVSQEGCWSKKKVKNTYVYFFSS